jgi:hypothetical protein
MSKKHIDVPSKNMTLIQRKYIGELLLVHFTGYMRKAEQETPDSINYKYYKIIAEEFFKLSERYRPTSTTHTNLPSRNLPRNMKHHICDVLRLDQEQWMTEANKIDVEDDEYSIHMDMAREYNKLAMKYKPAPKPKPEPEKI